MMSVDSPDAAEVADEGDGDGEEKGRVGKAARIMARALWLVDWSAANPDATSEDRKAAWKAGAEGRSGKVKQARKAIKIMAKRGVTLIVAAGASSDPTEDDD